MQIFYIASLCLFVAVVSAKPTDEVKNIIEKAHEQCQAEPASKLDDATLEKLKNHEKVDISILGKHALCMNVKTGFQNENGDVIVEKIRTVAEKHIDDKEKVNKIIEKCGTKGSGTPEEAALALDKCLEETGGRAPNHGPRRHHGPGPHGSGPHGPRHGEHKN